MLRPDSHGCLLKNEGSSIHFNPYRWESHRVEGQCINFYLRFKNNTEDIIAAPWFQLQEASIDIGNGIILRRVFFLHLLHCLTINTIRTCNSPLRLLRLLLNSSSRCQRSLKILLVPSSNLFSILPIFMHAD